MADSWQTIEQAAVSLGISVRTVNRHMAAGKLPSRLSAEGRREVLVSLPDSASAAAPTMTSGATTAAWHSPFAGSSSVSPPTAEHSHATKNNASDTSDTTSALPFNQAVAPPVTVDAETVLALADNAAQKAEMAVTAYQTLARFADTQVRASRRNARVAWAAAALMAAGVTVTVGWSTRNITRASADVERLHDQVTTGKQDLRALADRQEAMRADHAASEQGLRAELTARYEKTVSDRFTAEQALRGELSAAREQAARAEGQLAAYYEQEVARQQREAVAAAAVEKPAPAVAAVPEPIGASSPATLPRPSRPTPVIETAEAKPAVPTTRQSAPHHKAVATTRPSVESSDTSAAASTAEER